MITSLPGRASRRLLIAICFFISSFSHAQPVEQFVKVIVAPDHTNWVYAPGEKVKFTISVLQNGNIVKNSTVKYEIGPEKMDPIKTDSLVLANGTLVVDGGTMKVPGFLRCIAKATINNATYRGLGTAAFDPQLI